MFAGTPSHGHSKPIFIAQVVGITAPAIYGSLTFAYSHMVVPPLTTHAPPKLLAKQWLQAYQYASAFVPPLVISGTISNALLAYYARSIRLRAVYAAAAVMVWSIIPVTLTYFEPGVNGAGKWKVEQILKEDGYRMEENRGLMPSPYVHTATPESRHWAERVDMKDIADKWAQLNKGRYIITGLAGLLSAIATCYWKDPILG